MGLDLSSLKRRVSLAKNRGDKFATLLETSMKENCPSGEIRNLSFLLPLIFHYGGDALSLTDYPTMEPLYNIVRPPRILMLCSRQVGKTMNMAMDTWLEAMWTPHWNTLFVSPFYETVRRVSTDYFSALAEQSPVPQLFFGRGCTKQVLERTLPNNSRIRFTYAHRTADRARGIHARSMKRDEVQLMSEEVRPVLEATMASSPFGVYTFDAGTPLTNANPASREFKEASSRSHWMIPCRGCGKENIAALEYDLIKMIGPVHANIDRDHPGIICSKCRYYLYPWDGRFIHLNPDKRDEYLGLHVPLTVLPLHCCDVKKWQDLHNILADQRIPEFQKYNEYLGVPYDDGVAMITENDLDKIAVLGQNRLAELIPKLHKYRGRLAVGVDWGGGGLTRESLTKIAVVGIAPDGKTDILFGLPLINRMTRMQEAKIVWEVLRAVQPDVFCHDVASVGDAAEEMVVGMGWPVTKVMPMRYVGETNGMMILRAKPTPDVPRSIFNIDKSRSLQFYAQAIKNGQIRSFEKTQTLHARDLLLDFTHLRAEEKVYVGTMKSETILVHKEAGQSDDFAHAANFASLGVWSITNTWPKLSKPLILTSPQDLASYVSELHGLLDPQAIEAFIMARANGEPLSTGA